MEKIRFMRKIGIIGAMDLEVETLKSKLTDVTITTKAGMEFHEGILNGAPVIVVRCGIGKVNAALCVQIMADVFGATHKSLVIKVPANYEGTTFCGKKVTKG